ncbi:hypothetical protein ACHAXN_007423 [Cyclotella atomus]
MNVEPLDSRDSTGNLPCPLKQFNSAVKMKKFNTTKKGTRRRATISHGSSRSISHELINNEPRRPLRRLSSSGLSILATITSVSSTEGRVAAFSSERRASDFDIAHASSSSSNHDNSHNRPIRRTRRAAEATPPREMPRQLLACPPKYTGPYPTPTCAHYYYCRRGEIVDNLIHECGDGLLFSLETGICDWKSGVVCSVDGEGEKKEEEGDAEEDIESSSSKSATEVVTDSSGVAIQESSYPQTTETDSNEQEETTTSRPTRPLRPIQPSEITNIETRDDILQVTQNNDGSVTLSLVNSRPLRPVEGAAVNTIYINQQGGEDGSYQEEQVVQMMVSQSQVANSQDASIVSSTSQDTTSTPFTQLPSYTPTSSPSDHRDPITGNRYRPPIYYPNFALRKCDSDPLYKPRWTSEEEMFSSKEECCIEYFDWVSMESCLGVGFVESNYWSEPTESPVTGEPTLRPVGIATAGPQEVAVIAMSSTLDDAQGYTNPSLLSTDEPTLSPSSFPSTPSPSTSPVLPRDPVSGQRYGPPIYYPNYALQNCNSDPVYKPRWTPDEELFSSKVACCEMHFGHVLDKCLGFGFVEDNLISDAPSTPTALPSSSPSIDVSGVPSSVPSVTPQPSSAPVGTPTFSPVTNDPTRSPSEKPTLVPSVSPTFNLTGMPTFSPSYVPSFSPSRSPTSKPTKRPTHFMQAIVATAPPVATSTSTTSTAAAAATSDEPQQQELVAKSSQYDSNQGNDGANNFPTYSPTYSWPTYSPTLATGAQNSNTAAPKTPGSGAYGYPTYTPSYMTRSPNIINNMPTTFSPTIATPAPSAGPKSVGLSIPLDKAATVSEGENITPFGNLESLTVDGTIDNRYDTMLSVDLGFLMAIPDYNTITLRLYVLEADGDYCGTFQTTSNPWWDEDSVTWMNAPGANGNVLGDAVVNQDSEWVELDVTEVLTVMEAESNNLLSVRLFSNEGSRCVFASNNGSNMLQAPNLLLLLNQRNEVDVDEAAGARPPRRI